MQTTQIRALIAPFFAACLKAAKENGGDPNFTIEAANSIYFGKPQNVANFTFKLYRVEYFGWHFSIYSNFHVDAETTVIMYTCTRDRALTAINQGRRHLWRQLGKMQAEAATNG